jgi:peptidoglycan/LPS O-acetylase OafA/YrhL
MNSSVNQHRKFRADIEGLRAVAAFLVAAYHIWLNRVSGGVDVFFVVSGYLITNSLLRRFEEGGISRFINFWLGLARRLFPAAFLVLYAVTLASMVWLPQVRWGQTIQELFASVFYYQNWQLAYNAVDYLAQHNEASPVQHFWAMSVQGQFYILWPFIIFGSAIIARHIIKRPMKVVLIPVLIIVLGLSLSYSVYETSHTQAWAYFDTFTRLWEFCLGGLAAVLISNLTIPKPMSTWISWLGLIAIVTCGLVLQVSTVFPGYAALWPTLGALCIILAGSHEDRFGVSRFLAWKPLQWLGKMSYAFYLWHWPILVFYLIIFGNEQVPLLDGWIIIIVSLCLSYLTTTFVEKPIRDLKISGASQKLAAVAMACMVPVVALISAWSASVERPYHAPSVADVDNKYPGAMVLLNPELAETIDSNVPMVPAPVQARDDLPKVYGDKCHQSQKKSEVILCEYGELKKPKYTIAVVGGSHSAHWLPALEEFAEEERIRIISATKSSCRFTSDADDNSCREWNDKLITMLIANPPDLVFTTADSGDKNNKGRVPKGFLEQWSKLRKAGVKVFAIRDNYWFKFDVPSCVEEHGADSVKCTVEREKALPKESAWDKLDDKPENVYYADLSDYLCDDRYCRPVVGNVLVYRDKHHLTATYARTLAPMLKEKIVDALHN